MFGLKLRKARKAPEEAVRFAEMTAHVVRSYSHIRVSDAGLGYLKSEMVTAYVHGCVNTPEDEAAMFLARHLHTLTTKCARESAKMQSAITAYTMMTAFAGAAKKRVKLGLVKPEIYRRDIAPLLMDVVETIQSAFSAPTTCIPLSYRQPQ